MKSILIQAGYTQSLINFRGPLLKTLKERGFRIIACAPQRDPEIEKELKKMNIEFIITPMYTASVNPFKDIITLFNLVKLYKNRKPDIFLAYTIKSVIFGSIAAKLSGIRAIYSIITGLGYTFETTTLSQTILNKISQTLYRLALAANNKIFFQNPDDLNLFLSRKIIKDREKTVLINGSGIDLDHFRISESFPQKITFILIARIIREKGIIEYAEAARILKSRYPDMECQLLGYFYESPGALKPSLINAWVRDGNINYLGETNDVRPFIKECSVYVLPSYREGTPRTVLEAMAMGRPVITTDVPGCRETVRHGENGFLVPPRDPVALAETMEIFIKDPSLCPKMGRVSRRIAEEKYDVHKVNAVILKAMGITDKTEAM